jgi:hypothetical protein
VPVGIDLGQPPKNAFHSWCFFYSFPAIFEVPLYLIIDRTSDSCDFINASQTTHFDFSGTLTSLKRKSWWWCSVISKLPLQNSFHQKHLQDIKNQLLSASSFLCVDMRARYLNRSAMRMYELCYFLFLARENFKMIKRNFIYGFD